MASQQNCWAGVVYDKNRKSVVPVHSIKKFDPQNYTPKKYYKIAVDGTSKDCIVLGVRDTKEAVQKEVLSKRSSLPPANLIESASECSDLSELQSKSKNTKNLAPSVKGLNQQILELNQSSAKRQYEKDNAKEKMNPKKQKFDGKNSNPPSQRPSIPPLNKQSDRKIKVQNIQTIPASSLQACSIFGHQST